MDYELRQFERHRLENPERWLRSLSRSGLIEVTRLNEPDIYWDVLIRAGKLGPINQAVFGMLGFRPVVKCMGGQVPVDDKFTYWFKHRWYVESQVLAEANRWGYSWRGNDNEPYRKMLSRLSFYIRRIEWMEKVTLSLKPKDLSLDVWLADRESRTVLLSSLIGKSWTTS